MARFAVRLSVHPVVSCFAFAQGSRVWPRAVLFPGWPSSTIPKINRLLGGNNEL
jgi:hypothetical protein